MKPKLTSAARRELAEQRRLAELAPKTATVKPIATPSIALPPVEIVEWTGCYDLGWKGLIAEQSFSHPAKAARGLLQKIYDHLFTIGALKPKSIVVDPFGGIGTTAIEGAARGCQVICVELEPKFVDLATQNVELHRHVWETMHKPIPVIVQGDSRNLSKVIENADIWCKCDDSGS